jgi:AcrR family transcriptional regulator
MAPRKYLMTRRAAAAEATRLRVLEAAVALHAERGPVATKWADIAKRADVALGTVYRYFPSYEELLPACISYGEASIGPPNLGGVRANRSLQGRLAVSVKEIFNFYERAQSWLRHGECDRRKIPALDAIFRRREAVFEQLVGTALGTRAQGSHAVDATVVLTSFPTWRAFHDRGLPTTVAAALVTDMLIEWLGDGGDGDGGHGDGGATSS